MKKKRTGHFDFHGSNLKLMTRLEITISTIFDDTNSNQALTNLENIDRLGNLESLENVER